MADRKDPLIGYQFALEVQGVITGYFTEVGGIGSEQEIVEHKVTAPDGKDVIMKIPGRSKWGDITLKRGVTDALDCNAWRKMVEDGNIGGARKNGSIMVYDVQFKEIARWNKRWVKSPDKWLNRTAILFQNRWKKDIDQALLFANIDRHAAHPDFFIRKAIGWALRELGATDPESVKRFVKARKLSPLSEREALRKLRT